jgi:hypothetical protein
MEKWKQTLLGGTALAGSLLGGLGVAPVEAQQAPGTYTTQTANRADTATFVQMVAGGRTTCTTTQDTVANTTITITPPAGNYVYLTGLSIDVFPNATASTSATTWTSTNLTGSPAWLVSTTTAAAANPSAPFFLHDSYPTALRSTAPGTAVTIVPGATTASAFICARAFGYFSPQ